MRTTVVQHHNNQDENDTGLRNECLLREGKNEVYRNHIEGHIVSIVSLPISPQ